MKTLFFGRPCHITTRSDVFFHELLSELGDLRVVRREVISEEDTLSLAQEYAPDLTIFFQTRPSVNHHLLKLKNTRKVWVPMWEDVKILTWPRCVMHKLAGVEAVSFCEALHRVLRKRWQHSLLCQYYPEPDLTALSEKAKPPYTVFLWQRERDIGLERICNVFPRGWIGKVILKSDIPNYEIPQVPFEVERLQGWLEKDELLRKIQSADYYVAPRRVEGIGFSFLEAMALGKIVVSYDGATMNEYIQEGVNGHLFNDRGPLSTSWPSPQQMRAGITASVHQAHERWKRDRAHLKDFLSTKVPARLSSV